MIRSILRQAIDLINIMLIMHILFESFKPNHEIAYLLQNVLNPFLNPIREFLNKNIAFIRNIRFDIASVITILILTIIQKLLFL